MFVDTKHQGVVYPNPKPYLYSIQGKDPVSSENAGFVSTVLDSCRRIVAGT